MPNGVAISKRRFRLRLPQKNMFERFRNFRVRFRNGAPAQYFLTTRIRNLSGSISKWRSRQILPPKQNSKSFGFDFEMALPPRTCSKTDFEPFALPFRNAPDERLKLLWRRRRMRKRWDVEDAKCQVRLTPV